MSNIKAIAHINSDGILQLEVPKLRDRDLEVTIVEKPVARSSKKEWSPGFFDRTSGCWQGEPLVREPQGKPQERAPLL